MNTTATLEVFRYLGHKPPMTHPTRSLYAIDPDSQKVRLVVQVTPDGWSEDELEQLFAGLVPVLGSAGISIAIVMSAESAFIVRFDEKSNHFDIDEVEPAEVVGPYELDADPAKLFDTVSKWFHEVAKHWQDFVPQTTLPKRVPEIVPLIVGAKLRDRDGSIGIPNEQITRPVERKVD